MTKDHSRESDALIQAQGLFRDGLGCQERGELTQAELRYREALLLAPGRPSIQINLAIVLYQLERYAEAQSLCESLVAANPQHAAAYGHLGNCLAKQEAIDAALQAYDRALHLQPRLAEAYNNRGNLLFKMGRFAEALSDYDHALAINPGSAEGLYNRGRALRELQRPAEALDSHIRALAAHPDYPDLHYDLGNVLLDLGRLDEAAAHYLQASQLNPAAAERWNALGVVRQEQGRLDEALACYEKAIALDAHFPDVHYHRALALLYRRDFDQAWEDYEHRVISTGLGTPLRQDPHSMTLFAGLKRWGGPAGAVAGPVAIWGEQGIGDQLLFSTLLPDLITTGVPFMYEVDRRLLAAYQRAFPAVRFISLNEPPAAVLQEAEAVLLSGSLPGLFRPSPASYARQPLRLLSALPERVAHYRERLAAESPGLKVALSWRSTRTDRQGRVKSVALPQFASLFKVPGVQFVDVQYGDTTVEREALTSGQGARLLHFDEVNYHRDLEEVFAILEACDLLITTSNANAHFAGVLGKPAWLLYPAERAPFYYWAHGGDHRCLWYPSVEIISAPELADWPQLIAHVFKRLQQTALE